MAITFGLLGAGGMAKGWARSFAQVPAAALAGAWDPVSEQAEKLTAEFGGQVYPSLGALLADPAIQAVVVASPNRWHAEQTIAAARAGKHVISEKPMGMTLAECDAMIAAAREAGVLLMVGQALRFIAPFAGCLRLLRSGELGEARHVSVTRLGDPGGTSGWAGTWRSDESETKGMLWEVYVHEIDFIHQVVGVPDSVCALRSFHHSSPTPEGFDVLNVLFSCPGGKQGHLLVGELAGGGVDYAVFAEQGTLRWRAWEPKLYLTRAGATEPEELDVTQPLAGVAAELDGFCQALNGEGPVPVPGEEGRAAIATAEMIRAAWQTL